MTTTARVFGRLHNAGARTKVRFCRQLLEHLDPTCPPQKSRSREFLWQYRALCERVAVYEQYLDGSKEPVGPSDLAFQRAELALDNSLNYFKTVLAPDADESEEDDDQ